MCTLVCVFVHAVSKYVCTELTCMCLYMLVGLLMLPLCVCIWGELFLCVCVCVFARFSVCLFIQYVSEWICTESVFICLYVLVCDCTLPCVFVCVHLCTMCAVCAPCDVCIIVYICVMFVQCMRPVAFISLFTSMLYVCSVPYVPCCVYHSVRTSI